MNPFDELLNQIGAKPKPKTKPTAPTKKAVKPSNPLSDLLGKNEESRKKGEATLPKSKEVRPSRKDFQDPTPQMKSSGSRGSKTPAVDMLRRTNSAGAINPEFADTFTGRNIQFGLPVTPEYGWTLRRQEAEGLRSTIEAEMHSWDIQNLGVATFGDPTKVPKDKRALWQARQQHQARAQRILDGGVDQAPTYNPANYPGIDQGLLSSLSARPPMSYTDNALATVKAQNQARQYLSSDADVRSAQDLARVVRDRSREGSTFDPRIDANTRRRTGIDQMNSVNAPLVADNNSEIERALGMTGISAVSPLTGLTMGIANAGDVIQGRTPRGTTDIASFLGKTTPNIEGMGDAELYGRAAVSPLTRFFQEPASFARAGTGDTRLSDELSGLGAGAEFIANIIPQMAVGAATGGASLAGKVAAGVSLDLIPIAQMVQDMGGIDKLPAMGQQLVATAFDPNAPEGARVNAIGMLTMLGIGGVAGGVAGAKKLGGAVSNVPTPRTVGVRPTSIPEIINQRSVPKVADENLPTPTFRTPRTATKVDENVPSPTFRKPRPRIGLGDADVIAPESTPTPRPRLELGDADVLPTPKRTRAKKVVEPVSAEIAPTPKPQPPEPAFDNADVLPKPKSEVKVALPNGVREVQTPGGVRYVKTVDGKVPAGTTLHKTVDEAVGSKLPAPYVKPAPLESKEKSPKLSGQELASAGTKARQEKSLDNTQIRSGGKVVTLREQVDRLIDEGRTIEEKELPQYTTRDWDKKESRLKEDLRKLDIFRPDYQKRADAIKSQLKEGNPRIKTYAATNPDGSFVRLSKAQYDYAVSKQPTQPRAKFTPKEAEGYAGGEAPSLVGMAKGKAPEPPAKKFYEPDYKAEFTPEPQAKAEKSPDGLPFINRTPNSYMSFGKDPETLTGFDEVFKPGDVPRVRGENADSIESMMGYASSLIKNDDLGKMYVQDVKSRFDGTGVVKNSGEQALYVFPKSGKDGRRYYGKPDELQAIARAIKLSNENYRKQSAALKSVDPKPVEAGRAYKVTNMESLSRGVGAKYIIGIESPDGKSLVAYKWSRSADADLKSGQVLVDLNGNEVKRFTKPVQDSGYLPTAKKPDDSVEKLYNMPFQGGKITGWTPLDTGELTIIIKNSDGSERAFTGTERQIMAVRDNPQPQPKPEPTTVKEPWEMTREEFSGSPRLYSGVVNKAETPKKVFASTLEAPATPFMDGKFSIKKGKSQYAVYDGDKVVATYTLGDNLVVDPKYRRQGIATELLKAYKSEVDSAPSSASRSKEAQGVYNKAHKSAVETALKEGNPVPAEVLADYPDLAAKYAKGEVVADTAQAASEAFREADNALDVSMKRVNESRGKPGLLAFGTYFDRDIVTHDAFRAIYKKLKSGGTVDEAVEAGKSTVRSIVNDWNAKQPSGGFAANQKVWEGFLDNKLDAFAQKWNKQPEPTPTPKQAKGAKLKATLQEFTDADVIIGVKQGKNRGSVARINPEKVRLLKQLAKDAADYGIATVDEFVDYVGGMVNSASEETKKIFRVAAKQVWESERKPVEAKVEPSKQGSTGLANRVNDAEADAGSLTSSPKGTGAKKGMGQAEGKRQVEAGEVNPAMVANDIAQKQRAFADEVEVGVLMEGKRQLINARDSARAAWDKAIASKGDTTFARQEFDKAQAELDDFVGKVQTAKTKTSDAFRALQEGTRLEDGSFDDILDHYARKNNKKRSDLDLNSKDLIELKKVVEARDSTIKKLEEMIAKKESAKVETGFATAQAQSRRRGTRTREAIRADMDAAKARLKESVKKSLMADSSVAGSGLGALGGNFQALAKNAPEVVKAIKDIVVLTIEDLNIQRLDKTFYDAVRKESEMDLSDSEIRSVMAGFYNPNPKPATELQKRISSLKTQARILEEIKGVKDGTPIEKPVNKTKPDPAVAKLKKQLSDLTKPDRESKAKQATVARRIAKLDKEIALIKSGKTITRKTPGQVDPRIAKLQAERARLVKIRNLTAEIKAREAGTFKRKVNNSDPATDTQITALQKKISELRAVEADAKKRTMLIAKIKELQDMKQSGAKKTSQPRKQATNLDLRAVRDSLVKDLALRDTIADLEGQLASGNFAVKPPREVRELTVEQAKLQKRVDDLRKRIKMMVKLSEPKTTADKIADFVGASVLSNPVARAFDLAANTVKLGSYLITSGLRVPMHVAMDRLFLKGVSGGGERLITIRKLRRAMEGYGASVREESSLNMKGMDPDSASKYGRGSFVARATGMTDIPFKEFYNRLALDDMASAIAEKELGRRAPKADLDYRIRELIQSPTDEMVAVAHDWALRQTFNIDNVFGRGQRAIVTTFEELGRASGGDAGKAWGKVVGIIAETPFRFSKVIGNVALDRLNSNPVAAAIESSIRGASMVKHGYSPQQARLIADIAAKGLTGMALTYAGQYAYENGAYDPELIKTEGGTMFFDFGKIAQIGGPLAPFMFGAAMRKIEDLDLTEKQKAALRFKMTVDILADQPTFSGTKRVSQALDGEKGAEKFAGQVGSTLVPFSGLLGEWARQQDSYKTKQEFLKERRVKSDSFTDEFKKKIPFLRETLPDAKFTKVGKSGKTSSNSSSTPTDFSNMTNEELAKIAAGAN